MRVIYCSWDYRGLVIRAVRYFESWRAARVSLGSSYYGLRVPGKSTPPDPAAAAATGKGSGGFRDPPRERLERRARRRRGANFFALVSRVASAEGDGRRNSVSVNRCNELASMTHLYPPGDHRLFASLCAENGAALRALRERALAASRGMAIGGGDLGNGNRKYNEQRVTVSRGFVFTVSPRCRARQSIPQSSTDRCVFTFAQRKRSCVALAGKSTELCQPGRGLYMFFLAPIKTQRAVRAADSNASVLPARERAKSRP